MRPERVRVRGERSKGVKGRAGLVAEPRPLTPLDPSRLTYPSHPSPLASHRDGTVGGAVAAARRMLEAAAIHDAQQEAAELYAALVGRATGAAWLDRDRPCEPALAAALADAARRRAEGWPQAYAAGRVNFRGIWLSVDRRVLIPRPETEGLVDLVLAWMRGAGAASAGGLVADVGTGAGALAIALALESAAGRVVASDASAAALEVARANVAALALGAQVECREGHLLAPLGGARAAVVVSNPPYVATAEWERLEPGVRDFEPRAALDGGPDGLDPTRELVAAARDALVPGGLLALEVDTARARDVAALAAAAGFADCVVLEDLFARPRYVRARRPS